MRQFTFNTNLGYLSFTHTAFAQTTNTTIHAHQSSSLSQEILTGKIDSLISMKEKTLQGHWQQPFNVSTETIYAGKILWVLLWS